MLSRQPLFTTQNRGFRYGDGVFETIKIFRGKIILKEYHFDRLFASLQLLQIITPANFTSGMLLAKILDLCNLNNCLNSARVRLAVYRNEECKAEYIIEANVLDNEVSQLNEEGWTINIYPFIRKSCDAFANLKSANYLPYVMADLYSKQTGVNESIVLNSENNICDASKANMFLLKNGEVYSPALHQGCVNGVKRRFVIEQLKKEGIAIHQTTIDEKFLSEADEVFLTNAIQDLRWVKIFGNKIYSNSFVLQFSKRLFTTFYH